MTPPWQIGSGVAAQIHVTKTPIHVTKTPARRAIRIK